MSRPAHLAIVLQSLRQAMEGILAHKFRSFLTVLGVFIGASTVVGMLSIVQGLNDVVASAIQDMGTATFLVSKVPLTRSMSFEDYMRMSRYPDLSEADARALEESPWIRKATASVRGSFDARAGKLTVYDVTVKGLSSSFAEISEVKLERGRIFTEQENARRRPVCVLGASVASLLFPGVEAVGKRVVVHGHPFTVVGVLTKRGKMFGQDLDSVILVPFSSYAAAFAAQDPVLLAQADSPEHLAQAISDAIAILRARRGLKTEEDNNFFITTQDLLMTTYRHITSGIYAVMVGVAAISLLVGGVGIMNIMLVSVTERTPEIGIRKAVGAPQSALMLQFLSEAAGISSVGGVMGLLAGAGLASLIAATGFLPTKVVGWSVPLALLFTVGVGLAAGLYPALKAARLHPVEALRRE